MCQCKYSYQNGIDWDKGNPPCPCLGCIDRQDQIGMNLWQLFPSSWYFHVYNVVHISEFVSKNAKAFLKKGFRTNTDRFEIVEEEIWAVLKTCELGIRHYTHIKSEMWNTSSHWKSRFLKFMLTDIDECVSAPCQNGGTCTDQINGYLCQCAPGYTDRHCQTGKRIILEQI